MWKRSARRRWQVPEWAQGNRILARQDLEMMAEGFAAERLTHGIEVRACTSAEVDELLEIQAALEHMVLRRLAKPMNPGVDQMLRRVLDEGAHAIEQSDITAAVATNAASCSTLAELEWGRSPRQCRSGAASGCGD